MLYVFQDPHEYLPHTTLQFCLDTLRSSGLQLNLDGSLDYTAVMSVGSACGMELEETRTDFPGTYIANLK